MPLPSIRSLAKETGLSTATVSLALRDSSHVLPATKARILEAAQAAGYKPNPLVRSVMSALRRATHENHHGALMAVEYSKAKSPALNAYHRDVYEGLKTRAATLGYSADLVWVGPHALTLGRLSSILRARRIEGVIVMPFAETVDFSGLDWAPLSAIVIDFCVSAPTLHTVLPDHQLSTLHAMERLAELGYKRPGLALELWREVRINYRWSAGYQSYFRKLNTEFPVALLIEPALERERFIAWFKRERPDVIVGHRQKEITGWLRELGRRVPDDVGFFNLNWQERGAPCAGLDPQPKRLGGAAVEAAVAQLHRNEHGVPEYPKTINLPLRWVDGPTLRAGINVPPAAAAPRKAR